MEIMNVILWILLGMLIAYLIRVVIGPNVWDRLLGLNLVATKIILIIMVFASINEITFLLDFAMVYALSGFLSTIFLTLFLSERNSRIAKMEEAEKAEQTEKAKSSESSISSVSSKLEEPENMNFVD